MFAYGLSVLALINLLQRSLGIEGAGPLLRWNGISESYLDLISIPFIAIIEEFVFRLLPMVIIYKVFKNRVWSSKEILLVAITSSVIFGYVHGSIFNIFFQGVLGLILFWVYYKEYKSTQSIWKALLASSLVHMIYNYYLFFFWNKVSHCYGRLFCFKSIFDFCTLLYKWYTPVFRC